MLSLTTLPIASRLNAPWGGVRHTLRGEECGSRSHRVRLVRLSRPVRRYCWYGKNCVFSAKAGRDSERFAVQQLYDCIGAKAVWSSAGAGAEGAELEPISLISSHCSAVIGRMHFSEDTDCLSCRFVDEDVLREVVPWRAWCVIFRLSLHVLSLYRTARTDSGPMLIRRRGESRAGTSTAHTQVADTKCLETQSSSSSLSSYTMRISTSPHTLDLVTLPLSLIHI